MTLPVAAGAQTLEVDVLDHKVTTTTTPLFADCGLREREMPAAVDLSLQWIEVKHGARTVRYPLPGEIAWIVPVGPRIVLGYAHHVTTGQVADTIAAIDVASGAVTWQRRLVSEYAANLVGDLLAVDRGGWLEIVDTRTGRSVSETPIAGGGLQAICHAKSGALYVRTMFDLVALSPAGKLRWTQAATVRGNAAEVGDTVVDGWVDRSANRFGVAIYDVGTGRKLGAVDLGDTGGWYDFESITLAPDGPREVLVSSMFAVE